MAHGSELIENNKWLMAREGKDKKSVASSRLPADKARSAERRARSEDKQREKPLVVAG
jgi:hypothetical protein